MFIAENAVVTGVESMTTAAPDAEKAQLSGARRVAEIVAADTTT